MCLKQQYPFTVIGVLLLCIAFLFCPTGVSKAENGNAVNGLRLFRHCAACHHADREGNKAGPSLKNVMQRQAGTVPGYRFSSALKMAGENGLIWDKETLAAYLRNPQAMVKGTRMPPVRIITNEQDIDDLIAYLKEASGK